jgi:RloB-like protein
MARKTKNSQGFSPREKNTRTLKQNFLIVCEGAQTEVNYFESFRVPRTVVKGLGRNPTQIIQYAIDLSTKEKFDQVWCVFDRDIWTPQDFQQSFKLAYKHKIQIAYSNEAFELWYILHFQFLNTAIPRRDYSKKLSSLMGNPYAKNSRDMYDELFNLQPTAIAHADRLLQEYPEPNPVTDNPSTTVHLLVKELNRFI